MKKIAATVLVLCMLTTPVIADTIYIWTDERGVKRFSDQPPEGVENFESVDGTASKPGEQTRPGLERLVEEVRRENEEADRRRQKQEILRKADEKRKAEEQKNARIEAERARLQKQIDELNNRALSPTYTQGMRDNQIRMIQEKINALQ